VSGGITRGSPFATGRDRTSGPLPSPLCDLVPLWRGRRRRRLRDRREEALPGEYPRL